MLLSIHSTGWRTTYASAHRTARTKALPASPLPLSRGYAAPVRQGLKKKPQKRKITDMPGYKKKAKENLTAINEAMGGGKFVRLFGPNSDLPALPPEPKPTGKYSALFPEEDEVPKETEMMIGGTFEL